MRELQASRFGQEFEGVTKIEAPRSLAEIRAEDEEQKEIARRVRDGRATSRILVPSGWAN